MSAARAHAFTLDGAIGSAGPGTFAGIVVRETGASTAEVRVYDGTDNTGTLLDAVKLTSGQVVAGHGIAVAFVTGLYVDVVSGTVAGTVFVR